MLGAGSIDGYLGVAMRIVMYEVEYRMGSFAARGRHCRAGWTHPVKLGSGYGHYYVRPFVVCQISNILLRGGTVVVVVIVRRHP